ncbi:hypothetical protein P168DRAFT_155801 [Aspergillus campestris IBT 28561]|uniref:Uncharacterized protein n=1 Tax=Aspergillus campestris (strain IBT 28561) TaxID=1392248 RepID=A0A2I1D367_ASPC2|nr:uncharacterized protein P168DRAFT_155801 [Aspergillus campestris IBT 28561]PKY04305.1 hypothetical protein P168DRAFT_155801 [Aspergillus campestris IBT 28561]
MNWRKSDPILLSPFPSSLNKFKVLTAGSVGALPLYPGRVCRTHYPYSVIRASVLFSGCSAGFSIFLSVCSL